MATENATGHLLCFIGNNLTDIITGEVKQSELLTEDDLLDRHYQEDPATKRSLTYLRNIVKLYAVKQPGARVLEIGAKAGSAILAALESFDAGAGDISGSLLGHYDFTSASNEIIEVAKNKFGLWGKRNGFQEAQCRA